MAASSTNTATTKSLLQRLAPITIWAPQYKLSWLRGDLIAGLAIWAVTAPQGLAYAGIAGVPAVYGLYAVPLAMIAYAIFGSSRALSVGPDSATAALSAAAVGSLVAQGGEDYIALTAAMALVVGAFFLIGGLLRLGWVANFMANPVMAGFIQGLALVVIVGQLPKLFGVEGGDGNFFQQLGAIIKQLPEANPATVVVGFASLVLLFALKRFAPKVPAALVTVILAILVTSIFNLTEAGVDVVGTVEGGLPPFGRPDVTLEQMQELLWLALAIVLVGYAESLGAANSAAETTGEEIDSNQELVALGMSNIGSGLSSSFVVAGSLSRTSVVIGAGGRSQVVSLVNAGLVLLTLLFLMPFFQNLPQATLGAIVIQAMLGMVKPRYFSRLYRVSKPEFVYSLTAFFGELFFGILQGVLLGVILSLLLLIRRVTRPGTAVIGRIPGEETYRDVSLHPEAETVPGLLIFRFDAALIYSNSGFFNREVRRYMAESEEPVLEVLVDAETINDIDTTGTDHLVKLYTELEAEGVPLVFAHVKDPVRDMMRAAGAEKVIHPDHVFESIHDAIEEFKQRQVV